MADEEKNINNPETSPKGQEEVGTDVDMSDSHIADDEIDRELAELENKLKKAPEVKEPVYKEVTEKTTDTEQHEQPTEAISEDLLKKSPEELAKMYSNLQKKLGEQGNELGELRKLKEEDDRIKKEIESYQLSAANQHIVNNFIDNMSPDETNKFLEEFATNPKKAMLPIISEVMKPYTMTQAKYNNMMAVQTLKDKTKDDLIPYAKVEKEISKLLSQRDANGRNELWDRYGSGAFEQAYHRVRDVKLPEAIKQKETELISEAQKKAEEEYNRKMRAYTEPQAPTDNRNVGNVVDYNKLSPEEAIQRLEKILPHSS